MGESQGAWCELLFTDGKVHSITADSHKNAANATEILAAVETSEEFEGANGTRLRFSCWDRGVAGKRRSVVV